MLLTLSESHPPIDNLYLCYHIFILDMFKDMMPTVATVDIVSMLLYYSIFMRFVWTTGNTLSLRNDDYVVGSMLML